MALQGTFRFSRCAAYAVSPQCKSLRVDLRSPQDVLMTEELRGTCVTVALSTAPDTTDPRHSAPSLKLVLPPTLTWTTLNPPRTLTHETSQRYLGLALN